MGGGEILRAAAKMAGLGVFNAGARGVSIVPQFKQLLHGTSRPASVVVASSSSLQHAKATIGTEVEAMQKSLWEVGDLVFTGFEDDLAVVARGPKPRVVFGAVPSLEEAKEATAELKEALNKVYLSSPESSESNVTRSSNCELATKSRSIIASSPHDSVPNQALQAFKLLNESTQVQTVVASVVSDPNVWDAMMNNEELKNFMQLYQTNKGLESQKSSEEFEGAPDASNAKESGNVFSTMLEHMKTFIANMGAKASSFLEKIFGFPAAEVSADDKATSGLNSAEKTTGALIMGLVILVVSILVTKRI